MRVFSAPVLFYYPTPSGFGSTNIALATYNIDGSTGVGMASYDGTFDEVTEDVTAVIPAFANAGPKAQYKGIGTINGAGNFGFMMFAIDAAHTPSTDIDLFRIKIWDKDAGDAVVYDNEIGSGDDAEPSTQIGGGSIKIHTKGKM